MAKGTDDASPFLAVPIQFAIATSAGVVWKSSSYAGLEHRDLLLGRASGGQMTAVELRARAAGAFKRLPEIEAATFLFFYVIEGSISFEMSDEALVTLKRREAVHLPFLSNVRSARYSADLRVLEVRAPGSVPRDELVPLLQIAPTKAPSAWESMIVRNKPELFIAGDGPRAFFTYRDLGSAAITDRRIHIHDGDGAKKPMAGGTGWHNHSMSQLFFVLDGEAVVSVEGQGTHHMVAGDTMMIGKRMTHNVSSYSEGYNVVEVCLPADYDTLDQPTPITS